MYRLMTNFSRGFFRLCLTSPTCHTRQLHLDVGLRRVMSSEHALASSALACFGLPAALKEIPRSRSSLWPSFEG